jgi:hypothetical protein
MRPEASVRSATFIVLPAPAALGAHPVFLGVDVLHQVARQHHGHRGGRVQHDVVEKGTRRAPVELARVVIGLLEILRAACDVLGPDRLHAAVRVDAQRALDRERERGHRERERLAARHQPLEALAQGARLHERRGRVEAADVIGQRAALAEPADRVPHHCVGAGVVVRQFGRSHERRLGAAGAGDLRDLVVVGRDDHVVEQPAGARRVDRVRDDRLAGERANVLARDALAATARGDDREPHASALRSAATTSSCCASVSVANIGRLIACA